MTDIESAIEFALRAHQGQVRKGTDIPYIAHPLAVGVTLARSGCSDPVIIAGILHDTIEDTPVTLEDLRRTFGHEVAEIVNGASEPDKSLPWEERKQQTIDFLKRAPQKIRFVAIADKLNNIRAISSDYKEKGDNLWERFRRGKDSQRWYYQGLVQALSDNSDDPAYETLHSHFAQTVKEVFGNAD